MFIYICNICSLLHFSSKKALQDFFQSLRAKKPTLQPNIQHYHVHYYPMPYSMLTWPKVPVKRELEKLYDDTFASFGWPDYYYNYLPHPSIFMSDLQQLWDAELPSEFKSYFTENILVPDDTPAAIDRNGQGLLMQVPLNQQLVFHLLRRSQQRQLAKAAT
ncbi:uncharacterized protein LOC114937871 [Nylanderia fulva]|uniref:uncharacterized protein LOC114937871 n=1 Tax=Nylanderia fulva TaxID=613905 RepID=UPI0010FB8A0A|nr:uncharacterized protein LOC114937871 [Nylanderia fulva]